MTVKINASQGKPRVHWQELTQEQEREFYKLLVSHNYAEAASQIGMNAYYQGEALRRVGHAIYQRIDPDKLSIDKELQEMVTTAIESRKIYKGRKPGSGNEMTSVEQAFQPTELLDPSDTKNLVVGGRNKAFILLHKKMDHLNKNKKALEATSLSQLGTLAGILFDKSQVIQGQATENISVLSKNIRDGMTPEEMLELTLRRREQTIVEKSKD